MINTVQLPTTHHVVQSGLNHRNPYLEAFTTLFWIVIAPFRFVLQYLRIDLSRTVIPMYLEIAEHDEKRALKLFLISILKWEFCIPIKPRLDECVKILQGIDEKTVTSTPAFMNKLSCASAALIHLARTNNINQWTKQSNQNFILPNFEKTSNFEIENKAIIYEAATAYLIHGMTLQNQGDLTNNYLYKNLINLIEYNKNRAKNSPTKLHFEYSVLCITKSFLEHCKDEKKREEILNYFSEDLRTLLTSSHFLGITTSRKYIEWTCGMILGPESLQDCNLKLREYIHFEEDQIDFINISARTLQLLLFEKEVKGKESKTGFNYRDIKLVNVRIEGKYINKEQEINYDTLPKTNEEQKSYLNNTEYDYIPDNKHTETSKLAKVATIILIHGIESKNDHIQKVTYEIFKKLTFTVRNLEKLEKFTEPETINVNITHFNQHTASIAIAYVNSRNNREEALEEIEKLLNREQKKKFKELDKFIVKSQKVKS